jgi:hypothetical protein
VAVLFSRRLFESVGGVCFGHGARSGGRRRSTGHPLLRKRPRRQSLSGIQFLREFVSDLICLMVLGAPSDWCVFFFWLPE